MPRAYKSTRYSARSRAKVAAYANASGTRARITAAGRGLLRTGGNAMFTRGRRTRYGSKSYETKYAETNWTDTVAATNSQLMGSLSAMVAQGPAENQRIGRKFTIRSISLRGEVKMPNNNNGWGTGAAYPQSDVCRILVIQDKQPNGASPTFSDVFAYNVPSGSPSIDWRAFRNMENIQRFNILADRTIRVQNANFPNGTGGAPCDIRPYNIYRRCKIPVEMKGSSAALANIVTNNVYVTIIGSAGYCTMNAIARIRYSDEG